MMLLLATLAILLFITIIITTEKIEKKFQLVLKIISIAFLLIPAFVVELLLNFPKESIIEARDCIPIHSVQDFTITLCNNVYVFEDGYGNLFVIPEEKASVETFPDEELREISISKVTIGEHYSDNVAFWLDFGLMSMKTTYRDKFEFLIPRNSLNFSSENYFRIISELPQEGSDYEEVK